MEDKLHYTITEFDKVSKKLTVDFGEDGYAIISLTEPFPETKEDLEKIIRDFAPTVEEKKAISIEDPGMNYIDNLIGETQKTTRSTWNMKKRIPERDEVTPTEMDINETPAAEVNLKKIQAKEV